MKPLAPASFSFLQLQFLPDTQSPSSLIKSVSTHSWPASLLRDLSQFPESSTFSWLTAATFSFGQALVIFVPPFAKCLLNDSWSQVSVGYVPRDFATLFLMDEGQVGLVVRNSDGELRVVPDIRNDRVLTVSEADPRCFCAVDRKLVFLTGSRGIGKIDLVSGECEVETVDWWHALNPFRRPYVIDARMLVTHGGLVLGVENGSVVAYDAETFEFVISIKTVPGVVRFLDVVEDEEGLITVFLLVENETVSLVRISDFLGSSRQLSGEKTFEWGEVVGIVALSPTVCCVADEARLYIAVFADIGAPPPIRVSEAPRDFIYGLYSSDQGAVAVVTAQTGIHTFTLRSLDVALSQESDRLRRFALAFDQFRSGDSRFEDAIVALQPTMELFEAFDNSLIAAIAGADPDDLTSFITAQLDCHIALVSLAYAHLKGTSSLFHENAYRLAALLGASLHLAQIPRDTDLWESIADGNFRSLIDIIHRDFESSNLPCDVLISMLNACHTSALKQPDIYGSNPSRPEALRDLIEYALQVPPPSPDLLEASLNFLGEWPPYLDPFSVCGDWFAASRCEEIAIRTSCCPLLAAVVCATPDGTASYPRYAAELGPDAVPVIIDCLSQRGCTAEMIEIGRFPEWRALIGASLNDDLIARAFHYVTDADTDLREAAALLAEAAEASGLTRDQALTLFALAKMCAIAAGENEFAARLYSKCGVMQVQSATRIGGDEIMPAQELLEELLERKNIALALCVYKCSEDERESPENADLLAKIVAAMTDRSQEEVTELLVDANAVWEIPEGIEAALGFRGLAAFMTAVRAAHEKLHRAEQPVDDLESSTESS
jgi:hypothetical protein